MIEREYRRAPFSLVGATQASALIGPDVLQREESRTHR
jgi:hypothetical protein